MDDNSLGQLSSIANLIHEQNSAKIKQVHQRLQDALAKRAQLLRRPGSLVDEREGESLGWQAQAIWSNSTDIALTFLDEEIQKLERDAEELLEKSKASFIKVKGFDALVEKATEAAKQKRAQKEEASQEALVNLRDRPTNT